MFTAILPNTSASVFSGYHEERKKKTALDVSFILDSL